MPAPLGLDADAEQEIRRHAAETYPNECCGALIASGDRIIEAFRLPNTTAEGARRRFMIAPVDYRLAEARARERQGTLVGFYHSHPDHPARPSATDLAQAWPNLTYIIVAVREGTPEDLKSWRLLDDRSGFEEI
jgi:proteasome lid subunit RPN8/RPN11